MFFNNNESRGKRIGEEGKNNGHDDSVIQFLFRNDSLEVLDTDFSISRNDFCITTSGKGWDETPFKLDVIDFGSKLYESNSFGSQRVVYSIRAMVKFKIVYFPVRAYLISFYFYFILIQSKNGR